MICDIIIDIKLKKQTVLVKYKFQYQIFIVTFIKIILYFDFRI